MDFKYFRSVVVSQLFAVARRPWLFPELLMNKKDDFWINHSAKKWFLSNAKGKRVFEYGSGYSTDFLAGVCKEIISVEGNPLWFKSSSKKKMKNKKVVLRTSKNAYVNEIAKHGMFDLVFVDAEYRSECAKKAWQHLKRGGVLVLDDANSIAHAKAIYDSFSGKKFKLGGLKSNTGGYWETGFVIKN